ncbi:amino acid ABC transporter permease [Rhizobium sp. 768_B6_N1_8]|uniref:amino acid ABC transporter permease n=1 Tax=unclassified Rhizobium TaxID=2613769 RepID=UPI003F21463B
MNYTFHWRPAFRALPEMLYGCVTTLQIALIAMVVGSCIAVVLAVMSDSRLSIFRAFSALWVEVARNTPALFQIYVVYFGLGQFDLHVSSISALTAGIAFNNAGYLAETFRGGLVAIPQTQTKAARSLGFGATATFRLFILPQLLRVVYGPLTNQLVWSILMTSLGVVVGLSSDLTGVTQQLNVKTFRTFEYFIIAAALYYAMAKLVMMGMRAMSWRLFRY